MAYISLSEAQQWFEGTRLTLTALDLELEASAMEMVQSHLRSRYTTDGWTNISTTPTVIRKIISLLHAAWYFNRTLMESVEMDTGSSYGDRLESLAMSLLGGVAGGSIAIPGEEPLVSATAMAFYPTDDTTAAGTTPQAFQMSAVF
jgi:hypothetical protein